MPGSATLRPEERKLVEGARERAVRLLRDGAPLREVLAQLTTAVETLGKNRTVASILLLDRDGLLRNGASPNLPADYLDAIDRLKPDPNLGTCAAAAATGEVVETPSFYADQRWAELRHLPMALGFVGAWSRPIKDPQGQVLGTFGTYFREERLPTPAEREAVEELAAAAAVAIRAHALG
ncbi:GAF domain-containing protein [Ramlibacter pallidus]|uniref:GAF domain-containing protein n=1 Tax=Ramlibacter pallidus TaxID=2780087 RepID=A0ABR9S1Q9_9BURK|nr:GAF domain-containing protein [Ramlibacter pallidus]MBE7367452.1 GAF domain-containing protein [Ramlibacter pallidus]